jgi:hypothetical protein
LEKIAAAVMHQHGYLKKQPWQRQKNIVLLEKKDKETYKSCNVIEAVEVIMTNTLRIVTKSTGFSLLKSS